MFTLALVHYSRTPQFPLTLVLLFPLSTPRTLTLNHAPNIPNTSIYIPCTRSYNLRTNITYFISKLARTRSGQLFPRMARYVAVWPTEVDQAASRQTEEDLQPGDEICPPYMLDRPDLVTL